MPGLGTWSPQKEREIEREGKKGGRRVRADGGYVGEDGYVVWCID